MPNHRDCFGSRKPRLLNFRSWQEIQEVNQEQKGNTMSFPRKQNCRTSSVKYQESGDEQSKHLWAQRDFPKLSLTDGAGLETASPAKVRLAAGLDAGPQPSQAHQERAAKQNSHPDLQIVPISGLQVKNKQGNSAIWIWSSLIQASFKPIYKVFSPWLGTESLAEQFIIMLKVNFGVCAGAGHRPCPRNPISSLTDGSLGLYQPHTANKAKASAEQSEPRETQHSWHPQQWQKSSGGTFKIKPSVKAHTLSQHFLLCTVWGFSVCFQLHNLS